MEPRKIVERVERQQELSEGSGERFSGYAVMGVSFSSGYVLAMRRFPASSLGEGYTSVWIQDPSQKWTFYQDAPTEQGCSRYFGKAVSRIIRKRIEIDWIGPGALTVEVPEAGFRWQIILKETWISNLYNTVAKWLPENFWQNERNMNLIGKAANLILKTGSMTLTGQVPNGQNFVSSARQFWFVAQSRAVLRGNDLGEVQSVQKQASIDDYWIPKRGMFVIANATMESYDQNRHYSAASPTLSSTPEETQKATLQLSR